MGGVLESFQVLHCHNGRCQFKESKAKPNSPNVVEMELDSIRNIVLTALQMGERIISFHVFVKEKKFLYF